MFIHQQRVGYNVRKRIGGYVVDTPIVPPESEGDYEDLSTYTLAGVDQPGGFSVSTTKLTVTDFQAVHDDVYLYKDFTAGYFKATNCIINFELNVVSMPQALSDYCGVLSFSNSPGSNGGNTQDTVHVEIVPSYPAPRYDTFDPNHFQLWITQGNWAGAYTIQDVGVTHYLTFTRDWAGGVAKGDINLSVYTDAARTILNTNHTNHWHRNDISAANGATTYQYLQVGYGTRVGHDATKVWNFTVDNVEIITNE